MVVRSVSEGKNKKTKKSVVPVVEEVVLTTPTELIPPVEEQVPSEEMDEEDDDDEGTYEAIQSFPPNTRDESTMRLLAQRIIFIDTDFTADLSSFVTSNLIRMNAEDEEDVITLIINSGGGNVSSGLFPILDTMMMTPAPIKTVVVGEAYSSAAVILSAGTPGLRFATPLSKIMIHGIAVDGLGGKENEIKQEAKILKDMNLQLMELMARFCGQPLRKIRRDCLKDHYMGAEEAVRYGIIDGVLSYSKVLPPLIK